jgi:hypothetical protein
MFVWFAARAQAKALALLVCKAAALIWATACDVYPSTRLRVRPFAGFVGNFFLRITYRRGRSSRLPPLLSRPPPCPPL